MIVYTLYKGDIIIIIIIIIIIYCNWVVTRWQWLFYMYTKHEIGTKYNNNNNNNNNMRTKICFIYCNVADGFGNRPGVL